MGSRSAAWLRAAEKYSAARWTRQRIGKNSNLFSISYISHGRAQSNVTVRKIWAATGAKESGGPDEHLDSHVLKWNLWISLVSPSFGVFKFYISQIWRLTSTWTSESLFKIDAFTALLPEPASTKIPLLKRHNTDSDYIVTATWLRLESARLHAAEK